MNYSFHPEAEKELLEAVNYYNGIQEKLGLEFAREVYRSVQNILLFPRAWTPLSSTVRRNLINRFPYGVIYQITEKEIYILAIMQLNRKPNYWEKREK
ncbi:MAG TPA: type II toxin-antitoxin system RelE/ParE family toxin [Candidatus Wujingus californicus]|uniref:type II toxin-antitoxin system RelE/ParE family toxin n=1 Tax=Candidatus Wujingus californicus TaxID=3367618 RepID=UPI0040263B87